jgi:hypothetical protein
LAVDLPSLADALVIVVLIVPGFVVVRLFTWVTALDRKFSDFNITVLSFIASLIVYVPFSYITSLDSIDKIRNGVFMPQTMSILLLLSLVIGLFPGLVVKLVFRRRYYYGTVWNSIAKGLPEKDVYVLVHTTLGQEIMGRIDSIGTGDTSKDVRLFDPKLIIRDKSSNAKKQMRLGKEMYLSEKDISSIAFL